MRPYPACDWTNLIFYDDFRQGLDPRYQRWLPFGGGQVRSIPQNHEIQSYQDAGIVTYAPGAGIPTGMGAGLNLVASRNRSGLLQSGCLTTFDMVSLQYAYMEAVIYADRGAGLWPAFWALPKDNLGDAELDIVEVFGHDPLNAYSTGISVAANPPINDQTKLPLDLSIPHSFGCQHGPDLLTWFVDGVAVKEMPTPAAMHCPLYMILNYAVYGDGAWQKGYEDAAYPGPAKANLPARMIVSRWGAWSTAQTVGQPPPRTLAW